MKKQIAAFITISALSGLTGCEISPHRGEVQVRDRDYDVRVVFTDSDRRIIREYYREDYRRLPPGLAKKDKIPPGHAFKLKRNHGVPPDIKWGYLEPDIERRLSRLPDGFMRVVIGADVGILNTRTRVVVDVLEDIND